MQEQGKTSVFQRKARFIGKETLHYARGKRVVVTGVIVTIVAMLMTCYFMVAGNISLLTHRVNSDIPVQVLLNKRANYGLVKKNIKVLSGVTNVKYADKKTELNELRKTYGKSIDIFKNSEAYLLDAYIVSVKGQDVASTTKKINKLDGVYKATYSSQQLQLVINFFSRINMYLLIFTLIMTLFLSGLLGSLVYTMVDHRRDMLHVMSLIGSSRSLIVLPLYCFVLGIGTISSIIGYIIAFIGYHVLYKHTGAYFSGMYSLLPPVSCLKYLFFVLLVIWAILALVTWIMTHNTLKADSL